MKRPLAAAIALALALGSAIGAETSGTGRLVLHLDFNTIQMTKAAVLSSLRSAAAFGFDTVLCVTSWSLRQLSKALQASQNPLARELRGRRS